MWRSSRASLAIENLHTFNFGVAISDHALPFPFVLRSQAFPTENRCAPIGF